MEARTIASPRPAAGGRRAQLTSLRDEGLARLVGGGSERAFAALYERYHQRLYRYCRSILRHDADAQDALQSTFASAYAALRDGRRDAPLRPWLFRIAHNEAISLLRQRRQADEVPEDLAASGADVTERADQRERLDRLVGDLRALPERQRAALLMRELSGLSHEEIAVALDASVAAAKQTIFEARRSLAEFQEGRAMTCEDVCRVVSDRDRRTARSRRVRAHLRHCAACSAFAAGIPARTSDLRALAPVLPPGVAAAVLARVTAKCVPGGGGAGAAGAGAGAGAGKTAVTLATAKVTAGVAVVAATVGAASVLEGHRHSATARTQPAPARMVTAAPPPSTSRLVAVEAQVGRSVARQSGSAAATRVGAAARGGHFDTADGLRAATRAPARRTAGVAMRGRSPGAGAGGAASRSGTDRGPRAAGGLGAHESSPGGGRAREGGAPGRTGPGQHHVQSGRAGGGQPAAGSAGGGRRSGKASGGADSSPTSRSLPGLASVPTPVTTVPPVDAGTRSSPASVAKGPHSS